MPSGVVLFYKIGSFSHINGCVEAQLRRVFPDRSVRTIDVLEDVVEREPLLRAGAFVGAVGSHLPRIVANRQNPRDFYTRLHWVWQAIRGRAIREARKCRPVFTFQTQSLFDAAAPGCPHFVYTDHTYLANRRYRGGRDFPVSPAWREAEAALYRHAARNFTSSSFCSMSLVEDYGEDPGRVECVFTGSNVSTAGAAGVEREPRTILFVGYEWERKGGPDLVAALRIVRESVSGVKLIIAGCRPGLQDPGVEERGRIPLSEMRDLFARAAIFCLPSHREPSATALGEACAFGIPSVSTRVGGTLDRVIDGETGWLVEPGDVPALAAALIQALEHPEEAHRRGENARAHFLRHFSWDAVGDKIGCSVRGFLESPL